MKFKSIIYYDNKISAINNIDNEIINKYSQFPVGSITKIITIICIFILQQKNKLNINDKLNKYLDENNISHIKIIDIINHRAGFVKNINLKIFKKFESATDIYNYYVIKNKVNLIKHRYGDYNYSNIGYIILGVIIEIITNIKYTDFVIKNILKPLKMNHSGFNKTNITLYNIKQKKLSTNEKNMRYLSSSSGMLISCIADLIKLSNFHKLLTKNTLEYFNKKQLLYIVNKKNGYLNIEHNGEITGGHTVLSFEYDMKWNIKKILLVLKTIF
jgi:CubicO group peptidase (beta-lactamase class C family)